MGQIRLARIQRRMTQEELAAQLQVRRVIVERDSVSRMEKGTRFVADYELPVLADIFEGSVYWLLTGKEV